MAARGPAARLSGCRNGCVTAAASLLLALSVAHGATPLAPVHAPLLATWPRATVPRAAAVRTRRPAVRLHGGHSHSHAHDHDDDEHGSGGHFFVRALRGVSSHRWWAASTQQLPDGSLAGVGGSVAVPRASGWRAFLPYEEDRITVLGAAVNVILSALKLAAGIYGHSAAMVADAGHSLSDLVSDAITMWSVRMGRLPPDEDHPYGHGRFEAVGSLMIALILVGTGWAIGSHAVGQATAILAGQSAVASAVAAGASHAHAHALHLAPGLPKGISLGAALLSLLSKEWLYRVTAAVGRKLGSSVVLANAQHHRSDALSSVVAFLGIGAAMLGLPLLDPIAGLSVCAMVAYTGFEVAADALLQLTDAVDNSMVARIGKMARETAGVAGCSSTRVRWSGQRLFVEVCVQLDPSLSASAANQICEGVRLAVLTRVPPAREVLVHWTPLPAPGAAEREAAAMAAAIAAGSAGAGADDAAGGLAADGSGRNCPLQVHVRRPPAEVEADVREAVSARCGSQVESIEHCTVHYLQFDTAVEVAIKVDDELTVRQAARIAESARQAIIADVAGVRMADIHLDLLDQSPRSMYAEGTFPEGEMDDDEGDDAQIELRGPLRPRVPVPPAAWPAAPRSVG